MLPFFAKVLERLILKRILPFINVNNILPDNQFGFRAKHSTIHQVHRVVDAITFALEKKLFCTCAFLDISQAFDRVRHEGLLSKLKKCIPPTYYILTKSYLEDRYFRIRHGSAYSSIAGIRAGVPQGGILSPVLFNIYTSDQPTMPNTLVADYADDKAIILTSADPVLASTYLQNHLSQMEDWYRKWRFKINQSKSIHTTFTLKQAQCPAVTLYNIQIPSTPTPRANTRSPSHLGTTY